MTLTEEQFNNLERYNYIKKDDNIDECLICLEQFIEDDTIVKVKCNHCFHNGCIEKWLCNESNKCPVCRIEIDKGTPKNY